MLENIDFTQLAHDIKLWGLELGFQQVAIGAAHTGNANQLLGEWLAEGRQGSMHYLTQNREKRERPELLVEHTIRIISVRMNYLPADTSVKENLKNLEKAYISRYALGRDYHKVVRKRLTQLAIKITEKIGAFNYRAFSDSAPVFEKPLAVQSGIGWMGKNTLILNREAGSWFFLGELFVDLPLPIDAPINNHCGSCTACLTICPTQAITTPYQLDARRCISYLTIENKGPIPEEFRKSMGNRIFGCDDCQIICPWNKFAKVSTEEDFKPRHQLNDIELTQLFSWSKETYLKKTEGSALRRATYEGWLRNIAVAFGNAPTSDKIIKALQSRQKHESELVREHVQWALKQHGV